MPTPFKNKKRKNKPTIPTGPVRLRLPKENEVIGVVDQRMGFGKMRVVCSDKKVRMCRIPGKYRRRLWVRTGDFVIVQPWEIQGDEKGDLIYKYTRVQAAALQKGGHLKGLEE